MNTPHYETHDEYCEREAREKAELDARFAAEEKARAKAHNKQIDEALADPLPETDGLPRDQWGMLAENSCGGCWKCRNSREVEAKTINSLLGPNDNGSRCGKGHTHTEPMTLESCEQCPDFAPRVGFQVGGYYSHMWFEQIGKDCLEWIMQTDGDFPIHDDDNPNGRQPLQLHLCGFQQLEAFVNFWGRWLRKHHPEHFDQETEE